MNTQSVTTKPAVGDELSLEQLEIFKKLLPLLVELGLSVAGGGVPPVNPDRPLTKAEAADFLGFGVRKLERYMKRRQIEYYKYGTGQTATVRFLRAELVRFRESRLVAAKKHRH